MSALFTSPAFAQTALPELADSEEPSIAEALPQEDLFLMEPTVVTATREPRSLSELPNTITVISAEEIAERQYRTLPEALFETPGVLTQSTSNSQGSPYIRGFTGYQTLALVDGIRLNNAVFRSGPNQYWNTIDLLGLETIELVKGQGSVLYGSDAIGGTLNALTRRPEYNGDPNTLNTFGRFYGRWSSAEDSYTGRVESGVSRDGEFGVIAGVSGKSFGDLDAAGIGRQAHSGYDELDGDVKIEYFLPSGALLTFMHQQVHQNDAWRAHKTTSGISWRGTTIGDERQRILDQDRYLSYLQLEGETEGGFADSYLFSLSHQRQSEQQDRIRADGRRDISGLDVDSYGIWGQLRKNSSIGELTWGGSYYLDVVDSFRNDFNADGSFKGSAIQGSVGDDSRYHLAGLFLQDRIQATERLELWVGARASYARAEADSVANPNGEGKISLRDDWWDLSGQVRFTYALDEAQDWRLFGGVSQGFRAPNLTDLTQFTEARTDEISTPSLGLESEKYLGFELGLRHSGQKVDASLTYYYTHIDNLITGRRTGRRVDGAFEVAKQNSADGYVQGVEFETRYRILDTFSIFGWAAWQEGSINTYITNDSGLVNQPLSRANPLSGELGARWNTSSNDIWIELVGIAAAKQDDLSFGDKNDTQRIPPGGTPGYFTLILRGGWQINDSIQLFAAIENLSDEEYRVHGSGVNAAGRNFVLGAEYTF